MQEVIMQDEMDNGFENITCYFVFAVELAS